MTQATAEDVRTMVTEELAQLADIELGRLTPDATLEDLDIDSLDLVELAQLIEERYGVQLEREDMKGVATIGQALDVIVARCT